MQKGWTAALLLVGGCVCVSITYGQEIHLKTRTIPTQTGVAGDADGADSAVQNPDLRGLVPARGNSRVVHQIVQFDHTPGVEDLDSILLGGAQVTGALPDNALVVSAPGGLARRPGGTIWMGRLTAQDKLSPALANTPKDGEGRILAVVEFHADVDITQQDAVEAALGATFFRPAGLLPWHVIVQVKSEELKVLSQREEIAYIFPADLTLFNAADMNACAGMLTTAGPVAQYANITHGWDLDSDHIAHLGYFFGNLTAKVPSTTVQSEIVRAFNEWASHVNVTFQPSVSATAARSVAIRFASGAHGDSYPFDGPGGALAHTFYPVPVNAESIAGDMHFDADENWHSGADIDIYSVALHEAGHAIGLSHSDQPGDVMYPYYRRGMVLSANDIGAAQELYGTAGSPVVTGPTTPTPPTLPPLTLTLDPAPATTQAAQIKLTGTATGGTAPDAVQWQTDHGYSGNATMAKSGVWTAANVPLVNGSNVVTVTAFDAANRVTSHSETISKTAAASSTASPVTIAITSPTSSVVTVSTSTIAVSGTASGGAGISQITWQTSNGATGTASGSTRWVASGIPIPQGNTTIVVRAFDAKGASAWVALVATRH